jgi:hypothetical protein
VNDACAPTAARCLALFEVRATVCAHGLTAAEVFPPAEDVGLVDLDVLKGVGLNLDAESERLLAAHRQQDFGDVHRD